MISAPQNIYDEPNFFAGYAQLRENPLSANAVIVDPTRDALLPSLSGKHIIDLGCGTGNFCRKAIAEGAKSVVGIDISERMLDIARKQSKEGEPLHYTRVSLDSWDAPSESADIIVSILALHYLPEIEPIFTQVNKALISGGRFVFCVEHPIMTAKRHNNGWIEDEVGQRQHWPLDNYHEEGERTAQWNFSNSTGTPQKHAVNIYHRTLSTYINAVLSAGLHLIEIAEPTPDEKAVIARPAFRAEQRRPAFLFVSAQKP